MQTIKTEDLYNAIDNANQKRLDFMNEFFSKKFKNLWCEADIYDNAIRCWGIGISAFITWLNKKGLGYEIIHDSAGQTGVFWFSWTELVNNK